MNFIDRLTSLTEYVHFVSAATKVPVHDQYPVFGRDAEITALLRLQAKELRLYWETEEKDVSALKDHQAKFHKAREDAWVGIKDMLGIQE